MTVRSTQGAREENPNSQRGTAPAPHSFSAGGGGRCTRHLWPFPLWGQQRATGGARRLSTVTGPGGGEEGSEAARGPPEGRGGADLPLSLQGGAGEEEPLLGPLVESPPPAWPGGAGSGAEMSQERPKFYRQELNKTVWEVPERYQNLSPVGSGAYGSVCSAFDRKTGLRVAVKKLSRPFQSIIHAKRTYRELRLLKHMKHENVIGLLDVFTPAKSLEEFNDVYLVTHLMGADLNNIVKCQKLTDDHVQFLIYQILRGLKYIHSADIIHRDLKPSNLAVNEDCELKILDFGLARHTDDEMTGYVATRWYRAPEIMLNWMHYNQTVDIWSVGCIMAELLTGRTLFPGTDHIDQLKLILRLVGTPGPELLKKISSESARNYIQSLSYMPKMNFENVFIGANPLAVDLLEKMLVLDTDKRITAAEALAHGYFSQYHDPDDEPVADPYDQSFESRELEIEEWKSLTYDEVVSFVPPPLDQEEMES